MRENSISLPLPLLVGKQTSVDLKIPHLDLNTEWLEHVLISLRRVEADVKLLRAAEKVWPEEIRCGRKFVEDQGKDEEMTSCPQCNCANIKRLLSVADSMDSGPFAICNLSLRLGGRVASKGKLRFPGLNFDSRVGFVVFFFFFKGAAAPCFLLNQLTAFNV